MAKPKAAPAKSYSIWKDKDGNIVGQDPIYDKQMAEQGYEPANDTEADAWIDNPSETTPAPVQTGQAPSTAMEPEKEPVDEAFVTRIMSTAGVDRGEAERRAKNVSGLMRSDPNYPVLKQGEDQFGDIPSQIGTGVEGALGGVSFGMIPFLEGKAGDLLEEGFGWVDNPFTSANIQRRKEANPTISLATDIGASLLQGGVGVAKTVAPKAFTKLGGVGRFIAATDITGRAAGSLATRSAAKGLGTTLGRETGEAAVEIGGLEARQAAGEALTRAESDVLEVFNASKNVNLVDRAVAAGTRIAPTATRTASEVATERAVRERATFVIQQKAAETFEKAGYNYNTSRMLAQTAAGIKNGIVTVPATAVASGVRRGFEKGLERNAMTQEERDAIDESIAAEMFDGGLEGAAFATALAVATPVALNGIGAGLKAVKGGVSLLARALSPVATFASPTARTADIRAAVTAAEILANTDVRSETAKLQRALQYQHDNMDSYISHIESIRTTELGDISPAPAEIQKIRTQINTIRNRYMTKNSEGQYRYDYVKLSEAFKKENIIRPTLQTNGSYRIEVELPQPIQVLQEELDSLYGTLNAINTSLGDILPDTELQRRVQVATMGSKVPRFPPQFGAAGRPQAAELGTAMTLGRGRGAAEPPTPATEFLRAEALQSLAGRRIGQLGSQLTETGITALIATQLGAELPTAIGAGVLLPQAKNLLVNPAAVINNYQTIQTVLERTSRASRNLSRFLTSTGQAQNEFALALRKETPVKSFITETKRNVLGIKDSEGKPRLGTQVPEAQQLYEMDKELLGKLSTPDAIGNIEETFGNDYEFMDAAYPSLSAGSVGVIPRQIAFLSSKLPRPQGREPTKKEVFSYGIYSKYVRDPDAIYSDIAEKNYVPSQALEVLNEVYPARLRQLRSQLFAAVTEAANAGERIVPKQQQVIDKILGIPTAGLSPAQIANIQSSMLTKPAPNNSGGISTKLPQLEREGLPR